MFYNDQSLSLYNMKSCYNKETAGTAEDHMAEKLIERLNNNSLPSHEIVMLDKGLCASCVLDYLFQTRGAEDEAICLQFLCLVREELIPEPEVQNQKMRWT